jgi:hypothetical protein
MTATEQQVKMAARLYQCRDAARKLYGNEYKSKVKWYIDTIEKCKKDHDTNTLRAVLALCNLPSVKENGMSTMLFMAAAVEIIEPTKE